MTSLHEKYSVIIVEDDLSYQEIIKKLIAEDNRLSVCCVVPDSLEAARSIYKEKPDILILDVKIEGLNGLEMLELLYERPQTIVVSSNPSYKTESEEQEVVGFINKPIKDSTGFRKLIDQSINNIKMAVC